MKYYYTTKINKVIYSCDGKAEFPASLLLSSMSHDPSEIGLVCWYYNLQNWYVCLFGIFSIVLWVSQQKLLLKDGAVPTLLDPPAYPQPVSNQFPFKCFIRGEYYKYKSNFRLTDTRVTEMTQWPKPCYSDSSVQWTQKIMQTPVTDT